MNHFTKISEKRFDIFKTTLGIVVLTSSIYLFLKYFVDTKITDYEETVFIALMIGIGLLFMLGLLLFILGFTEMDYIHSYEITETQLKYIKSIVNLKDEIELDKTNLNAKQKDRFKKYLDEKIKDLIEGFE